MRAYDELEIRTAAGVTLRALERLPAAAPRAAVVLVHGLRSRKEAFAELSDALVAADFHTIAFDFHDGDFDTLVRGDLAAVAECVRARVETAPLLVVADGLGARVAVAAQAGGHIQADALVLLGGSGLWRLAAATPLARRYRMLAGAALAPGVGELNVPVVHSGRLSDRSRAVGDIELALNQTKPHRPPTAD